MDTKEGKIITYFAAISAIVGIVQIIIGQIDYNSIWFGLSKAYIFFAIAVLMVGIAKVVEILQYIKESISK